MNLISFTILCGPSFWGEVPVAKCVLKFPALTETDKSQLQQRWQHCQNTIPRLPNFDLSSETLAQAFTLLAIHLQTNGRQLMSAPGVVTEVGSDHFIVGVPFEDRTIVKYACETAGRILTLGMTANTSEAKRQTDLTMVNQSLFSYRRNTNRRRLHADPAWLIQEFIKHGVPCEHLFENFLLLGQGKFQCQMFHTYGKNTPYLSQVLSSNKNMTYRLLKNANLPVPSQWYVASVEMAQNKAKKIGYPVVVKPQDGKQGKNVYIHLQSDVEVKAAFQNIKDAGRQVIVEKFISGDEYRLLVIEGKFIAAVKRIPGQIRGDGAHTIRELLEIRNRPYHGDDVRKIFLRPLTFDSTAASMMKEKGYSLDSILKDGEILLLRKVSNLASGGTSENVTDRVHSAVKSMAIRTAKTIGLDMAGIDYLSSDITLPPHQAGGAICEVNACPGLRVHNSTTVGPLQDVFTPILNLHYPDGVPFRMTQIVICGNSSSDQLADIVFGWLKNEGLCPGYYRSGQVCLGTDETELANQSLLKAHDIFVRHADLDSCLWSLSYDELGEFGLPDDDIDLIIDLGDAENKPLNDMLQHNTQAYHLARNIMPEKLVIPTLKPDDDPLVALVESFKK